MGEIVVWGFEDYLKYAAYEDAGEHCARISAPDDTAMGSP